MFSFGKQAPIPPILTAIDLGYGNVKYASTQHDKFLSAVGTPTTGLEHIMDTVNNQDPLNTLAIEYNGKTYYVGNNAVKNTRNGRLTLRQNKANDEFNIVKFITALALQTNEPYTEFEVITGLPVLEFRTERASLEEMMKQKFQVRQRTALGYVNKTLKVNSVKVISQGEGAFYDYVLGVNGDIHHERLDIVNGNVMVVDIGYRTTDIVTLSNGAYVDPMSDQLNKGVNFIHKELSRLIMERFNVKKELVDMDQITRNRGFYNNLKMSNVDKELDELALPFAEDIVENLHTISNDTLGSFNYVLVTGGGTYILYPYISNLLKHVVNITRMRDPEYCNVSGYLKYGNLLLQHA